MADNFLEKQYEEWKNGRPSVRRNSPSLESLIGKLGVKGEPDTSYIVKQAQLDAMVRAASALGYRQQFSTDEAGASVTVSGDDAMMLGQAVLVIRLKAAELKLQAEAGAVSDGSVTLKISKAL